MRRGRAAALIGLAALTLALTAACGGNAEPTAVPTPMPGLPPGGPPAWPYIFRGNATVAGDPIPAGTPVFARMGSARSLVAETLEGRYLNIIVGPATVEDMDSEITFHLGDPDGPSVQAKETFDFEPLPEIANFELDLSFPRLP